MTIRPLADVPESIEILARWFHKEWHAFDGRSADLIAAQLAENLNRDSAPITFVVYRGIESDDRSSNSRLRRRLCQNDCNG